jgi:hypothetical protein
MSGSGSVARRQAELRLRVGEHVDSGEVFRAALWVARDPGLSMIAKVARWEGAPPGLLGFGGSDQVPARHSDVHGPESSTAASLDKHLPEHTEAVALALTEARLLLFTIAESPRAEVRPAGLLDQIRLAGRRMLGRGESAPLPPLRLVWQCPRAALHSVGVSDPEGRISLRFADGSSLSAIAPAMLALPFAQAVRHS